MSYRNDHDAALLRVDALETELETLRLAYEREQAKAEADKPPPKRKSRTGWIAGAVLAVTAGTAVGAVSLFRATNDPGPAAGSAMANEPESAPSLDDLTQLRECRAAITSLAQPPTAETADPIGKRVPVAPIVATGAPCRRLLANADLLAIDPALRAQVAKWSRAEDELAGDITRTMIYYESGPYAADNYRSAPQLWKEYDRAIAARNAVLVDLDPLL